MTAKKLFVSCLLLLCQSIWAQSDSITRLEEVVISDLQLKKFSNTQQVQQFNDSIIRKNQPSLTSLLNFNSVIYFKENGLGMVSSPSFRGTTAQQTAVVWNGININSQLNGQTDFNTVTTRDFNSISVRAGGGSSLYGSSAIGGSIHLNNKLVFENRFRNEVQLNYGSFNTFGAHYGINAGSEKVSVQASVSRNSSDNDYDYVDTDGKNLNGQFYNTSFSAALGYKLNGRNFLKFYSQLFEGERHFSLIFPSEIKTKYRDFNTRNMLEWDSFLGAFSSKLKVAALGEEYRYFANIANANYTYGKVESYIGKYDLAYDTKKIRLNAVFDYTQSSGRGSDIVSEQRRIGSAALLFRHQLTSKWLYEASIRKEFTDNYKSPLLFSAGTSYAPVSFYRLKLSGSRNFRIPTFNDLYWQPGGNRDLKPESSYQGEIGNEFTFKNGRFTVTGYYISIRDMIRWVPNGANWSPENTNKVHTYGGELLLNWTKTIGSNRFTFNGTYGYTISENEETKKQLVYVPYHKATASLGYSRKRFSATYQSLFTGEVFTRSDNNSRYNLDAFLVSNLMADYDFGKKESCKLGFQVLNLLNEHYASVESRFMPGRNFNVYLTFNF